MGVCSFDAGGFRRRRRHGGEKPVHPKSLRDSVLGQRDPQRVTEATVSCIKGVAAERGGGGGVLKARLRELALHAAAGILRRREAPLLPGGGAPPRETRQRRELCCLQRQ